MCSESVSLSAIFFSSRSCEWQARHVWSASERGLSAACVQATGDSARNPAMAAMAKSVLNVAPVVLPVPREIAIRIPLRSQYRDISQAPRAFDSRLRAPPRLPVHRLVLLHFLIH